MSRGLNKADIFLDDRDRQKFTDLLEQNTPVFHLNIFAHCLMSNHYHLVLCNTSGRMSDFMRVLNGSYANFFRKKNGGKGYLFQDRFKSILVENETYLYRVIEYTLVNPYSAGIVDNPFDYKWSSINSYFTSDSSFIDASLVKKMSRNKRQFAKSIMESKAIMIEPKKDRFCYYIGNPSFKKVIEQKFNRRKKNTNKHPRMRKKEENMVSAFKSAKFILKTYKKYHNISHLENFLSNRSYNTTKKADILIKFLKDEAGLTYKEISTFLGVRYASIAHRYRRSRQYDIPKQLLETIKGEI